MLDPVDGNRPCVRDERATAFLNEIVRHLDNIKGSLPRPQYDGKMDFACVLSNGDYALVEMQIIGTGVRLLMCLRFTGIS